MRALYRTSLALCLGTCLLISAARADIFLGALSYDTFIPTSAGVPGVDAFDIANLTGAFNLAPDFPVTDSLTFQSSVLTLTLSDSSQQVFNLGDIGPGFLLDGSGNPVVQVPDDESFISAEFTATLSPGTFALFDGSIFTANSASIDALLSPSSGPTLQADIDQTTISVSGSGTTVTPEPSYLLLVATGLSALIWSKTIGAWKKR